MKKYYLYISDFLRYFLYFFLEQLGISLMIWGALILSIWWIIWTFTFFLKIQWVEKMAESLSGFQYLYEQTQWVGATIDVNFLFILAVFLGTRFFLCTTIVSITIWLLNKKFNWIPEPKKWLKENIALILIFLHVLSLIAVMSIFVSIKDFSFSGIIQIILEVFISYLLGLLLFSTVMPCIILPGGLLYFYFTPKLSEETEKAIISFYKNLLK